SDGRFEPIAADARPSKDGFRAAWLKVVAGLCDVNAGALADRDKARRTRQRWLTGGAIAASVLLAAAAGAWAITQNSISVQAGGLVQEAIRSDNPLLAALAAEAPLPGFQVNGAAARDFLTAHRGLNTVSQAEIDRARVVKLDDMSLGGAVRRRLPEGARVEVSPGAFIEILYTCARTYTTTCPVTAVLHDGPAQRRIVADDATIQVSDGNARRAWTYASLAALLPEAPSAAVQAPVGEYDVLFGLAPSANAASRVRPEVLAVSRDASTLGWSAENNLFFVRLDDAAAVPRAMRVDFPVYDLRPLGGADWLVVGREASVVVSLADTPRVTPAPERVVGVGEIAYSESHRRGLAPGETNSAFFHVGPGGIEIDQQAAIAADIALASRDGEWLASYGEGALRVYSARDAALVQTQEFIRSTRSDGFVSFGQLDAMPAVIFLDLTGGVHIASLAAPPPIGSALFYERFCSARLVEAGRAEVRRIAPLFARRWREIESQCLNLEAEE
ncbi:MAG TPA: hypothetical protein PLN53_07775, partial [Terricaulis sp.]|nr:hypothetical protein [Terricaulis sp.]